MQWFELPVLSWTLLCAYAFIPIYFHPRRHFLAADTYSMGLARVGSKGDAV